MGAVRLRQADGGLIGSGLLVRRHDEEGRLQAANELAPALPRRQGMEAGRRTDRLRRGQGQLLRGEIQRSNGAGVTAGGAVGEGLLRRDSRVAGEVAGLS